MADSVKVQVIDTGLQAKIDALIKAGQSREMFAVIGRTITNRIRLCFKLGIDPWGAPWRPIKFREPRVGKGGKLTKAGREQVQANAAGKAGQPLRDSGRLGRSITSKADNSGVTIGTNQKYARVHQFGATITPKRGRYLVFPGPAGLPIFAKKVVIPRRSFLPVRNFGGPVVLPPSWSTGVVNRLRQFFRQAVKE